MGEFAARRSVDMAVVRTLSSTSDLVARALTERRASSSPVVCVAWQQTAGRGRRGRPWSSPPGSGVYASWGRIATARDLELVTLRAGLALGAALRAAGVVAGIKWPNDLIVRGRKIGGVLVEARSAPSGTRIELVVGFGVNWSAAEGLPGGATCWLEETDRPVPLERAASLLVGAVDRALRAPAVAADVIDGLEQTTVHRLGEPMRVARGEQVAAGAFAGFDRRGRLLLTIDGRKTAIDSGEVVEPEQ